MFENPIAQFIVELVRSLLLEGVSSRVRKAMARLFGRPVPRDFRGVIAAIHQRNRERLLHRLLTEPKDEP
jgi:hypothetical protein